MPALKELVAKQCNALLSASPGKRLGNKEDQPGAAFLDPEDLFLVCPEKKISACHGFCLATWQGTAKSIQSKNTRQALLLVPGGSARG